MDQNGKLNQLMVDLTKSVILESLKTLDMFQEKMTDLYQSMMPWLAGESGRAVKDLLNVYRKERERFQKRILQAYAGVEKLDHSTAADIEPPTPEAVLEDIEAKVLDQLNFGFIPEVLLVLSNPNSTRKDIEDLKGKVSPELLARFMNIADSAYFGTFKKGKVKSFYEAVMVLGMKQAQVILLFFSLFMLMKDKQTEMALAKGFARYVMGGHVFAKEFGLTEEESYELEMGCLFMDIGKIVILLYKAKYPEEYQRSNIDEAFIEKHHAYLGEKICDRFHINEEIRKTIFHTHFELDAKHVSLSGILRVIFCLVESIFPPNARKIAIVSPMPDDSDRLTHSIGVVIRDLFAAVGLSEYLEIIVPPPEDGLSQARS
jgi:HD-like signal output (HDOD) protein